MGSFYQRMWERNHCIHRDFQNAGVNGARASSIAEGIAASMMRSQSDAPILVFHAVIGNDVCNGHPGFSDMTTPAEFEASVLQTLSELNARLPNGSHVAFIPLVDGRVLWNTMHTLLHPTGATYPDVYDALICNECTPCWGWMNPNATDRNITSERAANLSAVYNTIIETYGHKYNFDMFYVPLDFDSMIAEYVTQGGAAEDLIEPSDGFHPSQLGQQLIAEAVWNLTAQAKPAWIPPVNPYNAQIEAIFGDQGGY
jgi:acyloxyacyl hydrolase